MGEKVEKSGLNFAYHNFGYDFNLYNGKMGIEWIIEETNPDWVRLQVDFYWVIRANKIMPKDLINLAQGRFKLWHIKTWIQLQRLHRITVQSIIQRFYQNQKFQDWRIII